MRGARWQQVRVLLVSSILVLGLSGCFGDGDSLLMHPSDLGAGFSYADLEDEEYAAFAAFLNLTSNPGSTDPEMFNQEEGYDATALEVAIIDFNGSGRAVFSAVITFSSSEEASRFIAEEMDCADEGADSIAGFQSGRHVAIHEGESLPEEADGRFAAGVKAYEERTGATSIC